MYILSENVTEAHNNVTNNVHKAQFWTTCPKGYSNYQYRKEDKTSDSTCYGIGVRAKYEMIPLPGNPELGKLNPTSQHG